MTDFYSDLYEKLYQIGYHSDQSLSHTPILFPHLEELTNHNKNLRILDIGCSHGFAVNQLRIMGYDAYGIDVAQTAIKYCYQRGLTTCHLASIIDTPFEDNYFDLVISSDTLEHLLPKDVPNMIKELKRINKGYCLLSIACNLEGNKSPLKRVKEVFHKYQELTTLHTCLMSPNSWDECFIKGGFEKIKTIHYENYLYIVVYQNESVL